MTELVESNHEHFEGPQGPAYVGEVPKKGDDYDVSNNHAQRSFLGRVHAEVAAEKVGMRDRERRERIIGVREKGEW